MDSWVQSAINWLPYGVPEQYQLEVQNGRPGAGLGESYTPLRVTLWCHPSSALRPPRALEPLERQRETEKAVAELRSANLDISAKDFYKPTEWQIRSERDARAALRALPQGASFQEKTAAARAAVHKINAELEHARSMRPTGRAGQFVGWKRTRRDDGPN